MTREERHQKLTEKIAKVQTDLATINFNMNFRRKYYSAQQYTIWHRFRRKLKKELKELNTQLETL